MIRYTESSKGLDAEMLAGFFEGWSNPPSPETHLQILQRSAHVVLALDHDAGRAVGFINAISDGVLCAHIPLLEVLPSHRRRGIGTVLVKRMLAWLRPLYMIDLLCDADVQPFYESCGMKRMSGMMVRNPDWNRAIVDG